MSERPRRLYFPQAGMARLAKRVGLDGAYLRMWKTGAFFWAANAPALLIDLVSRHQPIPTSYGRVLEDLRRDGCAFARVEDLWGKDALDALDGLSLSLARSVAPTQHGLGLPFMRLADPPVLERGGPLARFAMDRNLIGLAASYLGMAPRFRGLGLWHTYPYRGQRVGPQMWHRDSHDHRFFKVTVFLNDYGEEHGAMQYLRGTHFQGRYRDRLRPSVDSSGAARRFTDEEVAASISAPPITHFVGSRGTAVFFDTSGVHRSGYDPVGDRRIFSFYFNTLANTDHADFVRKSLVPTRDPLVDFAFGLL